MEKITLCIVPARGIEALESEILARMSPARRARYASFSIPEMKNEYLASSLALSKALYTFAGSDEAALTFRYGKIGRPVVDGACVSLTHTQGAAVCAAGNAPLGVDIEKHERRLGESLRARLGLCTSSPLDDWLARECYLKMTGEGLSGGIDRLRLQGNRISGAHVRFADYDIYRLAVCCREEFELEII